MVVSLILHNTRILVAEARQGRDNSFVNTVGGILPSCLHQYLFAFCPMKVLLSSSMSLMISQHEA